MDRHHAPIPQPHQNWSQHARLLPYLEQQLLYNAINWDFGARWRMAIPSIPIPTRPTTRRQHRQHPPDDRSGHDDLRASCARRIAIPAPPATFFVGGVNKLVGASNYPCNIGLNRRLNDWRAERSQLRRQQLGQDRQ